MTTYNETYSFTSGSRVSVEETPPDNINSLRYRDESEDITIATDPVGAMYTMTLGDVTFDLDYKTPPNTDITFTATAVFPKNRYALEYYWDFGDGGEGYGPEVVHSYSVENANIRATLRVTDNRGEHIFIGKQLYVLS